MTAYLAPFFDTQFFDGSTVAAGYKLYTYESGTTTPKTVYTNQAGTIAHTNPIILDADGRTPSMLWLGTGEYTFVLKTAADSTVWTRDDVSAPYDDIAALRTDLASAADAAKGAGLVGFGATLNYAVGTLGYSLNGREFSVRDFWQSGDADWAPALRRTLDKAASGSAVTTGGSVVLGPYKFEVGSTVYIPRSNAPIKIEGRGAVIVGAGAGSGTIFETAQGTTSTGGVSSFGTNELYLHYNTVIDGLQFMNCENALKLNNFLQGCVVRNCGVISGVQRLIWARRCFYLNVLNNSVLTSHDPAVAADTDACFRFDQENNGMVVMGNSALRSVNTKGAGFYFTGGCAGVRFMGNTAERCGKGLVISGQVYNMTVSDNYFEGNSRDLCVENSSYKDKLDVDGNWFNSPIAIEAVTWRSGELGKSNHFEGSGSVTINSTLGSDGALNSLHVWLPRQVLSESDARSTAIIPANWLLNGSVVVHRQASVYLAATGPSAQRALLSEACLGSEMIAAHNFAGTPGFKRFYASDGGVPYCTVTNNTSPGPGTIVVDTQITWDQYETGARFDFVVVDSLGTFRMCGWVSGTTVFRDDALAQTCVASINSGKLRLTLGNFTVGDIAGGVRII